MDEVIPLVPDHVLVRPIGKGGFGRVWLARNVVGTYRAVKVVSRSSLEREHDFQREFNGIQRFEPVSRRHEGLVDVLQIGRAADDSYFYYVMEIADDVEPRQEFAPAEYKPRTLTADLRRRSRIPAAEAALIGAQLADALAFLHSQGLIHRDIKPSNVMFLLGQARIGDPGLVAMIEASQSMGGTLGYIPPEGPGTPQADIFSLGKLLYVIATGKDPGEFPILPADMTSYEDVGDLQRLNHIILRACAYNPKDRYTSAVELRKDLLDVHAGGSPGETRRRLQIARRIGAGLLVLLLLILAGYYRAWLQARAERGRLTRTYMDTAIRLQDANDPMGALPFLGSMAEIAGEDERELALRRVSFVWRYGPRLVGQWYFTNAINRVAFDSSGMRLAIASSSGEVWLWRWRRQGPPVPLGRHGKAGMSAEAEGLGFSADGQWLASSGTDQTVRLWNIGETSATNRVITLKSEAHAVAFLPKDNRLVMACDDGQVRVSDLTRQNAQLLFKRANTPMLCVAVNSAGTRLVTGDRSGMIYDFDLENESAPRTKRLLWIYEVSVNSDESLLAAASGYRAHLNPLADQSPARLRHPALVRSVCFDPSKPPGADQLLTSCLDNTVRLWSCADDDEVMPSIHTDREPTCATFSRDGSMFAVSTVGGLVRVYCLPPNGDEVGVARTAVSTDGSRYARVDQDTNVVLFQSASGRVERRIPIAGPRIEQIDLDRSGTRLLVRQNLDEGLAHFEVWKVNEDGPIASTNIQCSVRALAASFSPDGNCVALRMTDRLILWQPFQGTSSAWPWTLPDPVGGAELRFSYRSPRLVVGWSSNVIVFSTTNAERIASWSFRHHAETVDIDATGSFVVVGESPPGFTASTNYVWNVHTRERASPPLITEDGSFVARFDPSGRSLILSDQKGNLILYDTATQKVRPLRQRSGMITDAAFSRNGRLMATSTEDRAGKIPNIQVWDVSSGEPVTPVLRVSLSAFGRVRFLAEDNGLLWFTARGNWHHWDLEKLPAPASKLADLARLLSCQQITATGESVSLPGSTLDRLWRELSEEYPDWFSVPTR